MHDLTEEEKRKVVAQVDYFITLVGQKYDVKPDEVLEAVKWVRERKAFSDKIKTTGLMSIIGLVISAVSMAMWEGMKTIVNRGN